MEILAQLFEGEACRFAPDSVLTECRRTPEKVMFNGKPRAQKDPGEGVAGA